MKVLPEGWTAQSLGSVLTFNYGKSLPAHARKAGSVTVYGSNGPVGLHNEVLVNGPAIVVGRKGSIGEVHYSTGPCWPIDTTYFIDDFGDHSPEFWFWYLKHLQLGSLDRATAIPGLNREDAYQSVVLVPPPQEQRRIVTKLAILFERSNTAREELARIPRLVERYKQAILAAAFRGDLSAQWRASTSRNTKDWKPSSIGEIADVGTGATPKRGTPRFYHNGTIPWVTSGAVNEDTIDHAEEMITKTALKETNCKVFPPGTLLVAMYGEGQTRGKVSVLKIHAATNQALAAIRVRAPERVSEKFLFWFLRANYLELRRQAAGGVQPNLNLGMIKATALSLPSIEEQLEIVRRVEQLLQRVDSLTREASVPLNLLERLEKATLAKAFRGELVGPRQLVEAEPSGKGDRK